MIWASRSSVDGAVAAGDRPWPGQSTPMLRNPPGEQFADLVVIMLLMAAAGQ